MARKGTMQQFPVLQSTLADALGTKRSRRPRLPGYRQQHAATVAIEALFDYLADVSRAGHPEEAKSASSHYQQLRSLDEEALLRSIQSLLPLLIEKHPRGAQIYNTVWKHAPHRLGVAYGKYLVTASPEVVVDELFQTYAEIMTS